MKNLTREAVLHQAAKLFALNVSYTVLGQPKPFNYTNPPPLVKISTIVPGVFYPMPVSINELIRLCKDPFAGIDSVLLGRAKERLAKGSRFLATVAA